MKYMLFFKKAFVIVSLLFPTVISFTQVAEKWAKTQFSDHNVRDAANGLAVDPRCNVYVTGTSIGNGTGYDYATIKYDDGGAKKWETRYNGQGNNDDEAIAIATDNTGNVYVTGWSIGTNSRKDYATIMYDDCGNTKWIKRYNGSGNDLDEPTAIIVDSSGNVYVTGYSIGKETSYDYATIKYDHDGNTKWVKRYNGPGNSVDFAAAIALDNNGNVYVTGRSISDGTGNDYATIKYDANGNLKWVKTYNGPANATDEATAVTVDDKGNVYVTGMATTFYTDDEDQIRTDVATIKYNADGVQKWVEIYDNAAADKGKAIAVDDAGNVYVTANGGSPDESYYRNFITVKYNASGVKQWATETVSPTGHAFEAEVHGLILDAAGNVYITGGVGNGEFQDYVTIRYNTNGDKQWTEYYNGPGSRTDIATTIGMDKKGNVYVSGVSDIGGADDYATIKYNSAGVKQWLERYNGPSNSGGAYSQATAIALDKDNNVYVTGNITRDNTGADFATYKYDKYGNKIWKKIYSGTGVGVDAAAGIVLDAQCNVYVAGTSAGNGTGDDFATIKYDKNGDTKWGKRYNGPGNGADHVAAVVADNKGNIYVTGSSTGNGTGSDFTTIKYDGDGNVKWVKRYNGPVNGQDEPTSIAIDENGNVFVTGRSASGFLNYDFTTIKYDSYGKQLWIARYNGEAIALKLDAAGNVYVIGRTFNTGTLTDYITIKYNTAGVQQWVATYNDPYNYLDYANALAVDDAGNVYVTGQSYGGGAGNDYATVKYNAAGVQQWVARYNASYYDAAFAMALDALGNVYVTGVASTSGSITTVKYNTAGEQQWVASHAGYIGTAITVDCNNNVYVTGGGPFTTIKYEQAPLLARSSIVAEQANPFIVDARPAQLSAQAFPNAFTDFINLQWSGSDKPVKITLTDVMGRLLEKKTGLPSSGTLKTGNNYPRGIYFAEIVQGTKKIVLKLIKK